MIWAQWLLLTWLLNVCGLRSRILCALLALLAFVPLHAGVSAAMAARGLCGDPSFTTLQLVVLALLHRTPIAIRYGWRLPAFIAGLSLLLYLSALGPWDIDLYRFGYRPGYLVATMAALALYAWWRGYPQFLWLFAIDLLLWRAGLLESTNLWDALVDPLLMLAMLAVAMRNRYRAHRHRKIIQPRI